MSNLSIFEQAGVTVDSNLKTTAEVFKASGLDWEVVQKPIYYGEDNSNNLYKDYTQIPKVVGNFRSDNDKFLGFVDPKKYKIVQNTQAFDFIDALEGFTFEKVGMFNGGKKVYVVGKSNYQIDIDGTGDVVDFYFTFLHGHDGKSGIKFIVSPIRMFCMNQMNMMLKQASFKHTITHMGDIDYKLAQIHEAINSTTVYVDRLQDEIEYQVSLPYTDDEIKDKIAYLFLPEVGDSDKVIERRQEYIDTVIDLYMNKPDLQNYRRTAFGFVGAVSDFISHLEPLRKMEDTYDNMLINLFEGNNIIDKARELAVYNG